MTLVAYGRSLAASMLAAMCLSSCDAGAPPPKPLEQPAHPPAQSGGGRADGAARAFSVYALSRGSGVPPAARDAQRKVRELVEADRVRGVKVDVRTIRLGLEGEQKLCVTYVEAQEAARALERIRAMVGGVDLVNVVVEPCGTAQ